MEATTIKLHTKTKRDLDDLRNETESYEQVVERLISTVRRKNLRKELKEGYLAMAEVDREIAKEWEAVDAEIEE